MEGAPEGDLATTTAQFPVCRPFASLRMHTLVSAIVPAIRRIPEWIDWLNHGRNAVAGHGAPELLLIGPGTIIWAPPEPEHGPLLVP